MKKCTVFYCTMLLMIYSNAYGNTVWNITNDFSVDNGNPNGSWSYGWMDPAFTNFTLYESGDYTGGVPQASPIWYTESTSPVYGSVWKNTSPFCCGTATGQLAMHPGVAGYYTGGPWPDGGLPAVARWTAPEGISGLCTIEGQFFPGDYDPTIQVAVRINGMQEWNAVDSGAFNLSANVAPGDTIDFTVYGGWNSGGTTPLDATITVAEPACLDMVLIPGGTFQMGDSFNESIGDRRELPVHTVLLNSFYIGKFKVTNGQYCQYLNSALGQGLITEPIDGVVYKADSGTSYPYCDTNTSSSYSQIAFSGGTFIVRTKGGRNMSNDPMVMVSWYGAAAYCNWLSQKEGKEQCYNLSTWNCDFSKKGYRLATEAEWEYAARGGLSGKRFPWGDTISQSQANYHACPSCYPYDVNPTEGYHPTWSADEIIPYTSPAGSFSANGYGVYDMAGNVWEWCNDWYGIYGSSPQTNPTGSPTSGSGCVLRGGCWIDDAESCRVARRSNADPLGRARYLGFRVVCVAEAPIADAGDNIQIASAEQVSTIVHGTATDGDGDLLEYRWLEGEQVLLDWSAVGSNGEAYLDLATLPYFSIGNHTLILEAREVKSCGLSSSDKMVLTIENSPPVVQAAPKHQVVEVGVDPIVVVGDAGDFDGDTLSYEWLDDSDNVLASGTVATTPGGEPVTIPDLNVPAGDARFPVGEHTVRLQVSDGINEPVTDSVSVEVTDTTAPSLSPVPSVTILWPPNHKLIPVTIWANAFDNGGGDIVLSVTVQSSEPADTLGDGNTDVDYYVDSVNNETGVIELRLRSERSGKGGGRIYTITITATDASGNSSVAVVEIRAPHDRRAK